MTVNGTGNGHGVEIVGFHRFEVRPQRPLEQRSDLGVCGEFVRKRAIASAYALKKYLGRELVKLLVLVHGPS